MTSEQTRDLNLSNINVIVNFRDMCMIVLVLEKLNNKYLRCVRDDAML